jgi:hypothetical protein
MDASARDTLQRCQSALRHHDGHPYGGWSTREQLAVALVLEDFEHIRAMDYTRAQAVRHVRDGMLAPPPDFDGWLDEIRRNLETPHLSHD